MSPQTPEAGADPRTPGRLSTLTRIRVRLAGLEPWFVLAVVLFAALSLFDAAWAPGPLSLRAGFAALASGALAGSVLGALLAAILAALRPLPRVAQVGVWSVVGLAVALWVATRLSVWANFDGPYRRLALLGLLASGAVGVALAALAMAVQPRPDMPRGAWGRSRKPYRLAGVACALAGAAAVTWADRRGLAPQYPVAFVTLRSTGLLLALAALVQAPGDWSVFRRVRLAWVAAPLLALALLMPAVMPSGISRSLLLEPYPGLALGLLSAITDADFDGYGAPWFGGGDCAGLNPRINPGTLEIPANGIDDNCRLGDAPPAALPQPDPVARSGGASPMSVVYITADAVSAEHVGVYGYARDTTPNVDAWARERAIVFEKAFTSGSATIVALSSIFRGTYPRRLRWSRAVKSTGEFFPFGQDGRYPIVPKGAVIGQIYRLPVYDAHPTLPQWLTKHGVTTRAVSAVHFLDANSNVFGRFQEQRVLTKKGQADPDDAGSTRTALEWLDQLGPDKPFFLYVHYLGPHSPSTRDPEVADFGRGVVGEYDHEVATFDHHVAPLLRKLSERQDRGDPLVVIVSADHGEEVLPDDRSHAQTLCDRVMRVPFLVSLPTRATGRRRDVVSAVDVFPTVLGFTGTPAPAGLDGVDLSEVITRGVTLGPRVVLADAWIIDKTDNMNANLTAATDGDRSLIWDLRTGGAELVDLARERQGERGDNLLETSDGGELDAALSAYLERVEVDPRATSP